MKDDFVGVNDLNESQLDQFRKTFLAIQKKYETKIYELSILKEMVESMKSIDLKDQDLIWRMQLDCLVKYKNLSGAIFYIIEDFQNKEEKYIYSGFEDPIDGSVFKNIDAFKIAVGEKRATIVENLAENGAVKGLEGGLYALPVVSGENLYGVLILLTNDKDGFKKNDGLFYSIVCGHLMNIVAFRRFYFGKIKEEKQILQLSRFFSKNVVHEILKSGVPRLGGERKKACAIFVDLRGFTTLSEKIGSEEVVNILNNFFSCMIPIVFKNRGTLDKLMGDCIMAIFGAPIDDIRCSYNAVKTALEMFLAFRDFKQDHGGLYNSLQMTVGINTGELVAGFIGSENHLNYTVIGDTVNSAQRLQSLAKTNQIYLSSTVFDEIKDDLDELKNIRSVALLGEIKLKGKKNVLNVYRIIPETC
ncbi:adenylate cyclase family protein [Desulforapulum autotrophicum HRM2]|uniref:Adenylate cyclase family protein n=1 Tax=Desulforapulum autotrophicum (strain ATCC 43914 / DSM 3382 / VKM B-1955 / HRM2) TaxID=177437 RepID=C0QLZ6_DESAH|nr:adenylate/guanylate cyclase domain-containing protein [Desulforapulum autotrophicum]ACN14302.1 adenylate cyclase family protein [Desulforapulum autotrophicum HRM2]